MLALYLHGHSVLHGMRPGAKLLFLLVSGTLLYFVDQWWILLIFLIASLGLYRVARLPLHTIWRQFVPLMWLLTLVFIGHVIFTDWLAGVVVVLRLVTLVLLAALVTLTTRMTQLIETITWISSPLERFGIRTDRLGLMLSLTLRYIPLLINRYTELRDAQRARCARTTTLSLLFPLLVQSLRLADQLAEAIDARGFDSAQPPDKELTDYD